MLRFSVAKLFHYNYILQYVYYKTRRWAYQIYSRINLGNFRCRNICHPENRKVQTSPVEYAPFNYKNMKMNLGSTYLPK